jgi:hypothetical protein
MDPFEVVLDQDAKNLAFARERVAKGMAWLLESGPLHGFYLKDINLDRLDLGNQCNCVLGQLGGDYTTVLDSLDLDGPQRILWPREHGFDFDSTSEATASYAMLDDAWREAITRELEAQET